MPEVRKLWQTEGLFSDHYLKARQVVSEVEGSFQRRKRVFGFLETGAEFFFVGIFEAELDEIVYRLYGLTPDEIELVKESSRP